MRPACLPLLALLASGASATDRVVAPGALPPRYATVSAALTAAADNDRILVVPAIYPENLSLTKSVEILSLIPGQRYTVTGNILIAPPQQPKRIALHDMRVLGSMTTTGQVNTAHSIAITGCITGTIDFGNNPAWWITLANDSILGRVSMPSGDLIGSYVRGDTLGQGGFRILQAGGSYHPLTIIGNILGDPYEIGLPSSVCSIDLFAVDTLRFENNFVRLYLNNYAHEPFCLNSAYNTVAPTARLVNNTFQRFGTAGSWEKVISDETVGYIASRNNLFIGPVIPAVLTAPYSDAYAIYTTDQAQVTHDTGRPIPGSVCVNAGDPDNAYADLDLSRNDAGCYGGSLSRDQFDDPWPNTADILWNHVARRVFSTAGVSIQGKAIDR